MKQKAFAFPPDYGPPSPLHVTMVGRDYSDGAGDYAYDSYRAPAELTAFEFVQEGHMDLTVNGQVCRPSAGDAYILHAGSTFKVRDVPGVRWSRLWFLTSGRLVENVLSAYGLDKVHLLPKCPAAELFAKAFRIASASRGGAQTVQEALRAVALEIVVRMASTVAVSRDPVSPDVSRVKNYIDSHLGENLSIERLSAMSAYSPAHFTRLFKRETGMTPHCYLLGRRIEVAKMLLLHVQSSIKEIAYRLGFANEYHFSNVFKQKVGESPSAFRGKSSAAQ
jgi:AraC-like DNA-binding protein